MSRSVTLSKFLGTFSLGLLTGTGFTTSLLTLGTLLPALPSASLASSALQLTALRTETVQTYLSVLSTASLFGAWYLSPPRGRHPYLIYAAAVTNIPWLVERLVGAERGWSSSSSSLSSSSARIGKGPHVDLVDHTTTTTTTAPAQNATSDSDEEWGKVSHVTGSGSANDTSSAKTGPVLPSATGSNATAVPGVSRGGVEDEEEKYEDDEINGEAITARMQGWRRTLAGRSAAWGAGFGVMLVGLWGDGL